MKLWKRNLPDPIQGLTLERLNRQLDAYTHGLVGDFAITAEAMEQRDDILRNVILKRKKAVARHGHAILTCGDSPQARQHKAALEYFYKNLRCTHVLKQDLDGGLNLLVHQMMDALAKGWSVHEITWRPRIAGHSPSTIQNPKSNIQNAANPSSNIQNPTTNIQNAASRIPNPASPIPNPASETQNPGTIGPCGSHIQLSADLRFIPLWFFENTTGKLRFLPEPFALQGHPLKPREWLITTADALMIACARAFLFKHSPLQAWLDYCNQYGTPGLRGVTTAARDTPEWLSMEHTLEQFMQDLAIVTNNTENIEVIDLKGRGESPFHLLIERMDRTMAALWRGADLSTLSRDRGYGASLQEQESRVLEVDDAALITETLNKTLDRWVIEYLFGQNTEPLAYIKLLVSPRECTPHDLAVDEFLIKHGARLSLARTLEHYGRAPAAPHEPALSAEPPVTQSRSDAPASGDLPAPSLQNNQHSAPPSTPTVLRPITQGCDEGATLGDLPFSSQPHRGCATPLSSHISHPESVAESNIQNPKTNIPYPASVAASNIQHPKTNISHPESPIPNHFMKTQIEQNEPNQMNHTTTELQNEFQVQQPVLLQLSPFGEFPHSKGIQLMDHDAAQNILKNFKSFFARLGRRFAGIPIYVGHPDLPGAENLYNDQKAYGWIMALHVKSDGLYGEPKWSTVGDDLIRNAHYKFLSPFWEASEVGVRNGRKLYRPHTLISVGLTNQPNLPMFPLSNERASGTPNRRRFFGLPMHLEVAQPSGASASVLEGAEPSPQLTHTSSPNPTPTALRPIAQGCDEGATLGDLPSSSQPQRGCATPLSSHIPDPESAAESHIPHPESAAASNIQHPKTNSHPESHISHPESGAASNIQNPRTNMSHPIQDPTSKIQHRTSHFMNNNKDQNKTKQPINELYPDIPSREDFPQGTRSKPDLEALLAHLQQSVQAMENQVSELNSRFLSVVVDNAILDGRIPPSDRERWRAELEHDWADKSLQLVNTLRTMKVDQRSEAFPSLAATNGELTQAQNKRIQKVLREKMANDGLTYDQAWEEFKQENPALMASLRQPLKPWQHDSPSSPKP